VNDPNDEPEYETPITGGTNGFGAEQKEEFLADLRDRLSIIGSNLENLARNKIMYTSQREGYEGDMERAKQRIAAIDKETVQDPNARSDRIQLEEAKIKDAEAKIARADDKIRNNARLIDAQNKMKARLEKDLGDLTR